MGSKDFLLDTNILAYLARFNLGHKCDECLKVGENYEKNKIKKVFICSITIGEIEYGLNIAPNPDLNKHKHKNIRDLYNLFPLIQIDKNIASNSYSVLRKRLFDLTGQARKKKWIEEWIDFTTSKTFNIQENDLWIASVAMSFNLIFVTNDDMEPIKKVAGHDIEFENWCV